MYKFLFPKKLLPRLVMGEARISASTVIGESIRWISARTTPTSANLMPINKVAADFDIIIEIIKPLTI
jgi:hypothetical protein